DADADAEPRRRFIREAQAASGLKHPNIVTILEIFSKDDMDFVVMELVAGKTLADLIPQGGLGVAKALHYGVQIADAVQTAHAAGIVHGGLRPNSILGTLQGQVKVLDFGMAKMTEGALTVEG